MLVEALRLNNSGGASRVENGKFDEGTLGALQWMYFHVYEHAVGISGRYLAV